LPCRHIDKKTVHELAADEDRFGSDIVTREASEIYPDVLLLLILSIDNVSLRSELKGAILARLNDSLSVMEAEAMIQALRTIKRQR
jgi:hypothetical protein